MHDPSSFRATRPALLSVIPAKAGIQDRGRLIAFAATWPLAFAGVTSISAGHGA
jgi:hypothetical protein